MVIHADIITGIASRFTSELVEGDKLLLSNGATTTVVSVTDNDTIVVSDILERLEMLSVVT